MYEDYIGNLVVVFKNQKNGYCGKAEIILNDDHLRKTLKKGEDFTEESISNDLKITFSVNGNRKIKSLFLKIVDRNKRTRPLEINGK